MIFQRWWPTGLLSEIGLPCLIEKEYGIHGLKVLGEANFGISNPVFILQSRDKRYILKAYYKNKIKTVKKLEYIYTCISDFKNDIPELVFPLKKKGTNLFYNFGHYYIFLYPYVLGQHVKTPNLDQIGSFLEILSRFHSSVRKIDINKLKSYEEKIISPDKDYILKITERMTTPYYIIQALDLVSEYNNKSFNRNNSLLHGDTDFTNYLFQGNKISAILDLDEVRIGDRIEELLISMLKQSLSDKQNLFDLRKIKRFAKEINRNDIDINLVDCYIYRYIFSSLSTFSKPSKTNKLITEYFMNLLKSYIINKEKIYKILEL